MPAKREIKAREIVQDIRSGLTDSDLMEKYNLTDRLLQKVFNRLVDAKVISWSEIQERVRPYEDSEHLQTVTVRILPREKVDFPLPVYEADHPEIRGFVKDITEKCL
jgi:hypothetical protein